MSIKEMNNPVDIRILKTIKDKGLKQVYIAKHAGYTPQKLSDMITGRCLIKACDIPKLAKALEVEINYLFLNEDTRERTIESLSTKELVEELRKRKGVKTEYAEPYQDKKLTINGPAEILIITD